MRDKLMEKMGKKGKKLNPLEKKAKMDVVKSLSEQASQMLGEKVKSFKAKSGEGSSTMDQYAKKAEELTGAKIGTEGRDPEALVEESEEELGRDLDNDDEEDESPEHKAKVLGDYYEDCSAEELEAKIQELTALKKQKESKKE